MSRSATPGTTKKNASAPRTTSAARMMRSFFFIGKRRTGRRGDEGKGRRRDRKTRRPDGVDRVIVRRKDAASRRCGEPFSRVSPGCNSSSHLSPSPRLPVSPSPCLPLIPYLDAAARLVCGARGVEDELRAVAVVEGGRAVNGCSPLGERRDDLAREDCEAARPLVVAQALGQRRGLRLDLAPLARAHARAKEPARALDPQSALRAEDRDAVLRLPG